MFASIQAHEVGASSIVMASHSRGFFEEFVLGSVTNYVTHHCTDIPVVVLHP
jgi:nucleotide-binding universal stress UspA family protein